MAKLDKIRWQCRRGLLELDLILQEFNRCHLAGLDPAQLECFTELLALPDNDLLDLAMGRAAAPEPRYHNVVQLLRAA
jgi:antitoxin CptB